MTTHSAIAPASRPLVSVIVPTKNSAGTLAACLDSIQKQTYAPIEIIVVDNFSGDDTQAIARKYTDKVFAKGPERCAQRNHAAQQATGDYVVFIDSDMQLSPKVIESCVVVMRDENIKGVIIPEESFGEGFWAQCKKLERSFYIGVDAIEAARFFRSSDFDAVGGYDELLVSGEDWNLSDRIEMHGALARITDFIYHNEGRINLRKTLQKKYYYAQKASWYFRQNANLPTAAKRRHGVFGRYMLFFRQPVTLFHNPFVGCGMLFMKTCEFGAGVCGYLDQKIRGKKAVHETSALVTPHELPFVSYILPTYNAEKYLERCLDSIFTQEYPKDRYEVLVADGGSTDATLEILQKYPQAAVIRNERRDAESGKYLAIQKSRGEAIVLIDSDNIIASRSWLMNMTNPLTKESAILGVESNYLLAPDFSSVNAYATLLVIVDPLARMLASKPKCLHKKNGYYIKTFSKGSSPVSGANGFLWRGDIVRANLNHATQKFEEATVLNAIAVKQEVSYANIPQVGVYHYYCVSLGDYIAKRKKIARKFLSRRAQGGRTWVDSRGRWNIVWSALYLGTIVGPSIEALYQIVRTRRVEWLWYPILSFMTVFVYARFFISDYIAQN